MKRASISLLVTAWLLLLLLLCADSPAVRAQESQAVSRERITTAAAVRLRAEPRLDAAEVGRLRFGTILQVLAQTETRTRAGESEDFWYRVAAPEGMEGWVFGALTVPFAAARRAEISRDIALTRLKPEEIAFTDAVEVTEFLAREVNASSASLPAAARAELELLRLRALSRSLSAIPFERQDQPPYRAWLESHKAEIVYSEPAGLWLVESERFWKLGEKYRALPIAERIAWEAAQNTLPGECEGFLVCHLSIFLLTEGRYLERYPRGVHTDEVLTRLGEMLSAALASSPQDVYEVPKEERADLQKRVAEIRQVVMKTSSPRKAALIEQLRRLGEKHRR